MAWLSAPAHAVAPEEAALAAEKGDGVDDMMDEDDEKFSDSDGFIGCLVVCMCIFIILGSVVWAILLIK